MNGWKKCVSVFLSAFMLFQICGTTAKELLNPSPTVSYVSQGKSVDVPLMPLVLPETKAVQTTMPEEKSINAEETKTVCLAAEDVFVDVADASPKVMSEGTMSLENEVSGFSGEDYSFATEAEENVTSEEEAITEELSEEDKEILAWLESEKEFVEASAPYEWKDPEPQSEGEGTSEEELFIYKAQEENNIESVETIAISEAATEPLMEEMPRSAPMATTVLTNTQGENVPSLVLSNNTTATSLVLTWKAISDAVSYDLEIDGDGENLVPVTGTSYTHTVESLSRHTYRIRANSSTAVGAWSDMYTYQLVSGYITTDTVWDIQKGGYVIIGSVNVKNGATLTVAAGTHCLFKRGLFLWVQSGSALQINGTANAPIVTTAIDCPNGTEPTGLYWGGICGETGSTVIATYWNSFRSVHSFSGNSHITSSGFYSCASGLAQLLFEVYTDKTAVFKYNMVEGQIAITKRGGSITLEDNEIVNTQGSPVYVNMAGTSPFSGTEWSTLLTENETAGSLYPEQLAIGGSLEANYTLPEGMYIIQNHITVPNGKTLTVEPGAAIYTVKDIKFTNKGTTVLCGTSDKHITYQTVGALSGTNVYAGKWTNDAAGTLTMQYVDMHYIPMVLYGHVSLQNNTISDCTQFDLHVQANQTNIMTQNTIDRQVVIRKYAEPLVFQISGNTIVNTGGTGFYVNLASAVDCASIYGTLVEDNTTADCLYPGKIAVGGTLGVNQTLGNDVSYIYQVDITIPNGKTLSVAAGTSIYAVHDHRVYNKGTYALNGTNDARITHTTVGALTGTTVNAKTLTNYKEGSLIMHYTDISYMPPVISGDFSIENASFSNVSGFLVYLEEGKTNIITDSLIANQLQIQKKGEPQSMEITGNTFANTGGAGVYISLASTMDAGNLYNHLLNNEMGECLYADAIAIGGTLGSNQTIPELSDGIIILQANVIVPGNMTWSVVGGNHLYVIKGVKLTVNGNCYFSGTSEKRITYTSVSALSETEVYAGAMTVPGTILATYTDFDYVGINITGNATISHASFSAKTTPAVTVNVDKTVSLTDSVFDSQLSLVINHGTYTISENAFRDADAVGIYIDLASNVNTDIYTDMMSDNDFASSVYPNAIGIGGVLSEQTIGGETVYTTRSLPALSYVICKNITIDAGNTLSFAAGAEISSLGGGFYVDGTLELNGTAEDNIVLTYVSDLFGEGCTGTKWNGVIANETGTIFMRYTHVRYYYDFTVYHHADVEDCEFVTYGTNGMIIDVNGGSVNICDNVLYYYNSDVGGGTGINICRAENIAKPESDTWKNWKMNDNVIHIMRESGDFFPLGVDLINFDFTLLENMNNEHAIGENGEELPCFISVFAGGKTVEKEITFMSGYTYYIVGDLSIGETGTMNIEKGVTVVMRNCQSYSGHIAKKIVVSGTLNMMGTREEPVRVIPYHHFYWKLYDSLFFSATNQWDGIQITETGKANIQYGNIYFVDSSFESSYVGFRVYGALDLRHSHIQLQKISSGSYSGDRYTEALLYVASEQEQTIYNNVFEDYSKSDFIYRYPEKNCYMAINGMPQNTVSLTNNYFIGSCEVPMNLITAGFSLDSTGIRPGELMTNGADVALGSFRITESDMANERPDIAVTFERFYSSDNREDGSFGVGWRFLLDCRMEKADIVNNLVYQFQKPDGSVCLFRETVTETEEGSEGSEGTEEIVVYEGINTRSTLSVLENGYCIKDKDGTSYLYDCDGFLTEIRDQYENAVQLVRDAQSRVICVLDTLNRMYTITYGENGKISSISDFTGRSVLYNYEYTTEDQIVLSQVTLPGGKIIKYTYTMAFDDHPQLETKRDADNRVLTQITYDDTLGTNYGKVKTITGPEGNTTTYTYDFGGGVTTKADSLGRNHQEYFNSYGLPTKTINADLTTVETGYYGLFGEVEYTIDRFGNKTSYTIDGRGNTTAVKDPNGYTKSYAYDEDNRLIQTTDANGKKVYYVYNEDGWLIKEIVPENGTDAYTEEADETKFAITSYAYYTDEENPPIRGLVKEKTDARGVKTMYTYDACGYPASVRVYAEDDTYTETLYTYDALGRCVREETPEGVVTSYHYDIAGNLLRITKESEDTAPSVSRRVYDANGNVLREISPEQYDAASDGLNAQTPHTVYSGTAGSTYTYDICNQMLTQTDSLGNTTSYTYDAYGNVLTKTLPSGGIYRYTYDATDRLLNTYFRESAEDTEILLSAYTYVVLDNQHLKTELRTYTNDTDYIFSYTITDGAGRVVEERAGDGTVMVTEYNKNGTVSRRSNGLYEERNVYDGQNRLTAQYVKVADGKYAYLGYTYDKNGNVTEEISSPNTVAYGKKPSNLVRITYTYDERGNMLTRSLDGVLLASRTYDKDNNMVHEVLHVDEESTMEQSYVYNDKGFVTAVKQTADAVDLYGSDMTGSVDLTESYTYDQNGNILSHTDKNGNVETFTYDAEGRQLSKSFDGYTESYTYDSMGNVSSTTGSDGITQRVRTYSYDARGLLRTETDGEGNTKAYAYDYAGRVICEVMPKDYDPDKAITETNRREYVYDGLGRILSVRRVYYDEEGEEQSFIENAYVYDANGKTLKALDAEGYAVGTGETTEEKITSGKGMVYTYDPRGLCLSVTSAENETVSYVYDALGRMTQMTDALGNVFTYTYDVSGNVTHEYVKEADTNQTKLLASYTYDRQARQLSKTDGKGNTTTKAYNEAGFVKNVAYPDGSFASYLYDTAGNLRFANESDLRHTLYTYDAKGNLLSETVQNPDGTESITQSYSYNGFGETVRETTPDGTITSYTYNSIGLPVAVTEGAHTENGAVVGGRTTTYTYDGNGNVVTTTDPFGNTSTTIYDALDRGVRFIDAEGTTQETAVYNLNGAKIQSGNAENQTTTYTFDYNNRIVSETTSAGVVTAYTYDGMGNVASETIGTGESIICKQYVYNYAGNVKMSKIIDKNLQENVDIDEETLYTYDTEGNILTVQNGNGHTTTYVYDSMNRVCATYDHGGADDDAKTETYAYDLLGNLIETTTKNGDTVSYTYDVRGNQLSVAVNDAIVHTYAYDSMNNCTTMTDSTGTTSRTFDRFGRVLSETVSGVGTTTYVYDITEGLPEGYTGECVTDPKGNTASYVYDTRGWLQEVKADDTTVSATYTYYANGARQSITYQNGTTTSYAYQGNLLSSLVTTDAEGNETERYAYTYDSTGNQIQKTESFGGVLYGTTVYTYDHAGRLKSVTTPLGQVTTYTYDKAGNRKTETVTENGTASVTTYTYNEQERLTGTETVVGEQTIKTVQFVYDNNGNTLLETINTYAEEAGEAVYQISAAGDSGTSVTVYTYNGLNQLISTQKNGITVQNVYNAEGLRTIKTVNGESTRFVYSGTDILLELNAEGTEKARYVYGLNLVSRTADDTDYIYLYNGHGDVTRLENQSGIAAATYRYDAFGNITEETGEIQNPFRYAGYFYDAENDIYYLRSRFYDPKTARFLQADSYLGNVYDPLSLNRYTYVENNPLMYVDPTGFMKSYAEWRAENPDDGPVWSVIHYFMYVLGETAEGIKTWGETHWAQMQMAFGSAQAYAAASTTPDVPLPQGTKAGQGKDWDPYSKRKDASRRKYPYPENPTDVWDYYPGEDWVEDADLFKNEITSSLSSDLSKKESLYDFFRNVVGPGLVVVGLFKKNPVLKVLGVTVGLGFMSMPSMEEHYNRNQHNIWFPDVYDDKYFYGWDDNVDASCHQFSSPNKSHKKYVSPDGRYEVIYDANDIRVDDPRDVGTYNFANPNTDMMGHFFKDVLPWIIWGNSPDDLTVWEERLEVFLTAIPNGTLRKVGVEI